jgi:hypothetical protein
VACEDTDDRGCFRVEDPRGFNDQESWVHDLARIDARAAERQRSAAPRSGVRCIASLACDFTPEEPIAKASGATDPQANCATITRASAARDSPVLWSASVVSGSPARLTAAAAARASRT